jgi:hypothetical protein
MALTVSYGHARHVVVTDEAIITVERRSEEEWRQASTAALVVGGGVMGALLAALVDQLGLPGGPMRLRVEGFRPATFYPRAIIESLVVTPWQLKMTLKREAARHVDVPLAPWTYRKVRAHLSRAGDVLASTARGTS